MNYTEKIRYSGADNYYICSCISPPCTVTEMFALTSLENPTRIFPRAAQSGPFLGAFYGKIVRRAYWLHICLSIYSSAWKTSSPNGRIFMKGYIWIFFKNLSRKFKFR